MVVELIDEGVVRRTAEVLGESSACAKALKEASIRRGRGEDVVLVRGRGSIIVVPRDAVQEVEASKQVE